MIELGLMDLARRDPVRLPAKRPVAGRRLAVGAGLNHQGDLVAAISTLGPQGEFDTDPNGTIGTTLKATGNKLSVRLGCNEKTNTRMTSAVRIPS